MIEVEDHLSRVLAAARTLPAEPVAVRHATGRTLATSGTAVHDIPSFENSSMDGYAVRFDDVAHASTGHPVDLEVVADLPAGSPADPPLRPGQAVRLMTGSALPSAADTVVPFEHTVDGLTADLPAHVLITTAPRQRGAFVRRQADDVAAGDTMVLAGSQLGPRHVGALLAAGIETVEVTRQPRVAVVSTGSELVTGTSTLTRGQVRESNGPMLAGLAQQAGAELMHVGTVVDDDDAVLGAVRRLEEAGADVIVFTGGVSAGAYDVVKSALGGTGQMRFSAVRMQPGKPQGLGTTPGGVLLVGLPGNPVSAAVSWEVFVRPALLQMQGRAHLDRRTARLPTATGWRTPPDRRQYVPVALDTSDPAAWTVHPVSAGHSGSHLVGSLAHADGYAVVPASVEVVEAGQLVDVMLLA